MTLISSVKRFHIVFTILGKTGRLLEEGTSQNKKIDILITAICFNLNLTYNLSPVYSGSLYQSEYYIFYVAIGLMGLYTPSFLQVVY